MSSATGLTRLSLVVAAVFAAGIAALVAASALIPTATVRNAVIADIRAITGLEPTIRGEVKVSLFPTAMVSFSDVAGRHGRAGTAPTSSPPSAAAAVADRQYRAGGCVADAAAHHRGTTRQLVGPDGDAARTLKPGAQSGAGSFWKSA